MAYSLKAKKLKHLHASREAKVQGWYYENARSIEVYLRDDTGKLTMSGRISRAQIAAWLKRTEPHAGDTSR